MADTEYVLRGFVLGGQQCYDAGQLGDEQLGDALFAHFMASRRVHCGYFFTTAPGALLSNKEERAQMAGLQRASNKIRARGLDVRDFSNAHGTTLTLHHQPL